MTENSGFTGKRVVVTGAASGIGRATALRLASAGADVLGVDRDPAVTGVPGIHSITADLTDLSDISSVVAESGTIDMLVNAAGVSITADIADVTDAIWDLTFAINTRAPFKLMQLLAPQMRDGGAIVNISSMAGKAATNIQGVPYNASKAAVMAMTRTFAYALAPRGIRVNAVCPGVTDTPMLTEIFEVQSGLSHAPAAELKTEYLKRVPLGRFGEPEEIAASIAFLLSDQASYVTGQSINVCGGLIMW